MGLPVCVQTGKPCHRHKAKAVACKNHLRTLSHHPAFVFACKHCGTWHVGRVSPNMGPERKPAGLRRRRDSLRRELSGHPQDESEDAAHG